MLLFIVYVYVYVVIISTFGSHLLTIFYRVIQTKLEQSRVISMNWSHTGLQLLHIQLVVRPREVSPVGR